MNHQHHDIAIKYITYRLDKIFELYGVVANDQRRGFYSANPIEAQNRGKMLKLLAFQFYSLVTAQLNGNTQDPVMFAASFTASEMKMKIYTELAQMGCLDDVENLPPIDINVADDIASFRSQNKM